MITAAPLWLNQAAKKVDANSIHLAREHQSQLTKPSGSLGQLETLAETFAGWQGKVTPCIDKINIVVFAADHGVCAQQVSAFPQVVTTQMITNFLDDGAAISVLSRELSATLTIVNMGTVAPLPEQYHQHPKLLQRLVGNGAGTADLSQQAAMSEDELNAALLIGQECVNNLDAELFVGGEMGIGNTTSASAIYAALLSLSPQDVAGAGTGVDDAGIQRKQQVIEQALVLHQPFLNDPYHVLRCVGGFEIAGLVGAYIACAQKGIPILVDGFISTAAVLLAVSINSSVREWCLFSHESAEAAHHHALKALSATPLLNLGLRLGEGSGAAIAVPLIRSALALHRSMATFEQASVSQQ